MAETNSKKKKKKFRLPGEFPGTRAEFDKKYGTKFKLPGEFPGTNAEFEKKYGGTTGNLVKKNGNQVKKNGNQVKKNGNQSNNTPTPAPKKKKKITARSRMEARNREIHGDDKITALKKKNKDFQAAKKKKGGMDEFAKNYPKSQTAKERKRRLKITTWRDLE